MWALSHVGLVSALSHAGVSHVGVVSCGGVSCGCCLMWVLSHVGVVSCGSCLMWELSLSCCAVIVVPLFKSSTVSVQANR